MNVKMIRGEIGDIEGMTKRKKAKRERSSDSEGGKRWWSKEEGCWSEKKKDGWDEKEMRKDSEETICTLNTRHAGKGINQRSRTV